MAPICCSDGDVRQSRLMTSVARDAFLRSLIRDVPDFPQPGIMFKDITTLMSKVAVSLHYVEAQKKLHTTWTSGDDQAEAKALIDVVTDVASTVLVGIAQADRPSVGSVLVGPEDVLGLAGVADGQRGVQDGATSDNFPSSMTGG